LVSPNAGQTNLWADDQHLSAAGQQAEANYLYNLIENATPVVSETLTASGQVALDSSATFTYQWQSLAPGQTNWSDIAGATGSTYVVQQSDHGFELRVEASYTDNTNQTTTAFSSATPAVVDASPASIISDYLAITRSALSLSDAATIANAIDAGTQTVTQYINGLLSQVANTTIPAIAVEASMYGVTGTSAEITNLTTNFLPAQVANAISHGLNPQVYACEVVGLAFAFGNENNSTAFANNFGPSNSMMPSTAAGDAAFASAACNTIFGGASTANLVNVLGGFVSNWKAFYTSVGIPGNATPTADQVDLAARGAAWGDMVGVALVTDIGPLNAQVINFIDDAAQGTAIYGASLVGQPAHQPFA
jgi:hypothetical protein